MSKNERYSIECPKCKRMFSILHWESINSKINPELKEILFDGYLWKYTCPNCGLEIETNSSLLYNNPEKNYMVQFEPIVRTKEQLRHRAQELTYEWNKMINNAGIGIMQEITKRMKYNYRLVNTQNELIEKIKIFDAGYYDVPIEIIKEGYREYLVEKEGKDGIQLYFDSMDEEKEMINIIIRASQYEQKRSFPAGPIYQFMKNAVLEVEERDKGICVKYVDNQFAVSIMDKIEKAKVKHNKKKCPRCEKIVLPTFHGLCPDCDEDLESIEFE